MEDPFATLGLAPDASPREVKKAWRRLAREHHPDVNPGDPEASRRFQEVKAAYDTLIDPERRAAWFRRSRQEDPQGPHEDWLDSVAWMAEHGWERARVDLLPRFVAAHGVGARLVWALRQALEAGDLAAAAPDVTPTLRHRWRARWLVRRVRLVVDDRPLLRGSPLSVRPGLGAPAVVLHLHELWRSGAREDAMVRPVVQRLVGLGLATAVTLVAPVGSMPSSAERAVEMDRAVRRRRRFWQGVWITVGVLVVVMVGSALWAGG